MLCPMSLPPYVLCLQKRVRSERATAKSLGAVHGRTVELAQAEAVLAVCQWRLRSLLRESQEVGHQPLLNLTTSSHFRNPLNIPSR